MVELALEAHSSILIDSFHTKDTEKRTYISKCVEDIRKVSGMGWGLGWNGMRTGMGLRLEYSLLLRAHGWCQDFAICTDWPRDSSRLDMDTKTRYTLYSNAILPSQTHTPSLPPAHILTHLYPLTHTHTPSLPPPHTHTHLHSLPHTYSFTFTPSHTHTPSLPPAHILTHLYPLTHTHTFTPSRTHTHSPLPPHTHSTK